MKKKMKLLNRLMIQTILPQEGSFATLTIKYDILDKIKTTQEELKNLNIKEENGMVKWDETKDIEKEFEFTELEEKMIKDSLIELDKNNKLTDENFNLYKLFN